MFFENLEDRRLLSHATHLHHVATLAHAATLRHAATLHHAHTVHHTATLAHAADVLHLKRVKHAAHEAHILRTTVLEDLVLTAQQKNDWVRERDTLLANRKRVTD